MYIDKHASDMQYNRQQNDQKASSVVRQPTARCQHWCEEELCRWKNFDLVAKDTDGFKSLRNFMRKEKNEENLDFWKKCESLEVNWSEEGAKDVLNEFVVVDAQREVNLDSEVRKMVSDSLTPDSLKIAQEQIGHLIERGPFPRFLETAAFREFVRRKINELAPKPIPVICGHLIANRPLQYGSEFHGLIARVEAEEMLSREGDGAYLVRASKRSADAYTLCMLFDAEVRYYKLYYDGNHYVGEKRFESLELLVADGLISMYIDKQAADMQYNRQQNDQKASSVVRQPTARCQHLLEEELCRWKNFDLVAKDTDGFKSLRKHMREEKNEENLDFWKECERLEVNWSEERAEAVLNEFVVVDAPREVNLDLNVRKMVSVSLTPESLKIAQKQIGHLIERDPFPRFLKTIAFHEFVQRKINLT